MSYSFTTSRSFTVTDARRLAAKVVADMHQCQRFYGHLTHADIKHYQQELEVLLSGGYIQSYEFGFQTKDKQRVVSWLYTVDASGNLEGGRSGGLFPAADVSGTVSFNFLSYSNVWYALDKAEKERVKARYPIRRTEGVSPKDGDGYWNSSRSYVSGGVAVTRKEFRPW